MARDVSAIIEINSGNLGPFPAPAGAGAFFITRERAGIGMKSFHLGIVAITCVLAGCSPDHRQADTNACIAQARHDAPLSAAAKDEESHDAVGSLVSDCMQAKGYRHDMVSEKCIDDVDFNSYCYTPRR